MINSIINSSIYRQLLFRSCPQTDFHSVTLWAGMQASWEVLFATGLQLKLVPQENWLLAQLCISSPTQAYAYTLNCTCLLRIIVIHEDYFEFLISLGLLFYLLFEHNCSDIQTINAWPRGWFLLLRYQCLKCDICQVEPFAFLYH